MNLDHVTERYISLLQQQQRSLIKREKEKGNDVEDKLENSLLYSFSLQLELYNPLDYDHRTRMEEYIRYRSNEIGGNIDKSKSGLSI